MYSTKKDSSGYHCGPAPEVFCLMTPVTVAVQKIDFWEESLGVIQNATFLLALWYLLGDSQD